MVIIDTGQQPSKSVNVPISSTVGHVLASMWFNLLAEVAANSRVGGLSGVVSCPDPTCEERVW